MGKRGSEHPPPPPPPPAQPSAAAAADGSTKQNSVCYYYDPSISYADYGEKHAMVPHRVAMTHALVRAYGLLGDMDRLLVAPATEADLELAHDPDFIRFLRDLTPANAKAKAKREAARKYKLGGCRTTDNPVFDNLWDYCRRYAGGSLAAARALASGRYRVAINWSGGMHHACRAHAGGFCYVNDVVVAVRALLHPGRRRRRFERVLYLDIDAHHGDGVEAAFEDDGRVLTVSFHQFHKDFFPGTGDVVEVELAGGGKFDCPTHINVPLPKGTGDERYHQLFGPIVDKVMAVFQPDAVVMQCGADSLAGDRLASLGLSVRGHAECVRIVKSHGLPLLLLGGGGYTTNRVASCWCYETAVAIGREMEIPDDIPQHGYQSYYESQGYKLHYHRKEEDDGDDSGEEMDEKQARGIMETVMKHLDCLSSKLMPKLMSVQAGDDRGEGEEPPCARARRADDPDDDDALVAVDRSPWDEDPVEMLFRLCGEHLVHDFFTDLGKKHPKRS